MKGRNGVAAQPSGCLVSRLPWLLLSPVLANRTPVSGGADTCRWNWCSVEIMSHVGSETLVMLNDDCCLLEDAYMKSIKRLKGMKVKHELLLHGAVCLREIVNNEDG